SSRPGFKRLVGMKLNGPMEPPCWGLDGGNIWVAGRRDTATSDEAPSFCLKRVYRFPRSILRPCRVRGPSTAAADCIEGWSQTRPPLACGCRVAERIHCPCDSSWFAGSCVRSAPQNAPSDSGPVRWAGELSQGACVIRLRGG